MKDRNLREDASGRIVGRGGIIAIVVVFSSLSFTLGFFVGNNNAKKKADSVAQVSDPAATQQNATLSNPQPVNPQVTPSGGEGHTGDKKLPEQGAVPSTTQSRPVSDKVTAEHAETVSAVSKEGPKNDSGEVVGADAKSASKPAEKDVIYTVQIGALKNAAEARNLKAKYTKKGYKTSITVSHGKQKEKIYKVRAGEFKEKKEAETLARRLKKTEGLSAFVTVKGN
ncbi:MAG TPA: SPOR domain-containing protein [Candidatus Sulfobium mesophilum]|nr:SPOR domain-containing protein [Candidatus Sulfobium mesophilum]